MRSRLANVPGWSVVCGMLLCAPGALAAPAPQAPDCNNDGINDSLQSPWGPISVPDEGSVNLAVGSNLNIDVLSNDGAAGGYYGGICLDGYACNGCASGSCGSNDTIIIISNPQHGNASMSQNAGGVNHGRVAFAFSDSSSYCGDYEYMLYQWRDTCGVVSSPTRIRVQIQCPQADQALSLNGNGWLLVQDTGVGSSIDLSAPFTIECWVKPSTSSTVEAIITKWGDVGINDRSFGIERWSTNQVQFGVSGSASQGDSSYHTFFSGTIQANVWQHIACTYDGTSRRTYVNGMLAGVKPATGAVHQGETHLAIGAKLGHNNQGPGDVSEFYHGLIDRVRIWPAALRQDQIQLFMNVRFLANANQPSSGPAPISSWEFDGNTNDSMGNNLASVVGTASFTGASTPPNVSFDCDANGLPDYYDIARFGGDLNGNGVLDRCEYVEYCSPGLAGVLACPCSNPPSSSGRGCNNSSNTGGGRLQASGIASLAIDTMVLSASALKPTALCTVWHGNVPVASGVQLGQGVRCSGGALKRLYNKTAVGGAITAPQGADPRISVRSAALGDPLAAGAHRYYFVTYRDPTVLGGCSSTLTFNGTQAVEAIWTP